MIYLEFLLPQTTKKTKELNGEITLDFTTMKDEVNARQFGELNHESVVIFEGQQYIVKNLITKTKGKKLTKKAKCVHKFFNDMINKMKFDVHNGSITFVDFMEFVFGDTPYNDYQINGFFRAKTIEGLGRESHMSMFNRGIEHYEIEFYLEQINSDVRLVIDEQIGKVTDAQLRYNYNVDTLEMEVDTKDLSTYIRGYGGNGVEAEYTSPNIDYFGKLDAPIVDDDRFKSKAAMLDELKKRIIDEPKLFIKIDSDEYERNVDRQTGEPLDVGDFAPFIFEPLNDFEDLLRVIKTETYYNSRLEVEKTIYTFSNDHEKFTGSYLNDVAKQIDEATKGFANHINMARNEANLQIRDNYIEVLNLPINVMEPLNAAAHLTIIGEGTTNNTLLDGYFTLDGERYDSIHIKQVLFNGWNTVSVNFILFQIQEGYHELKLFLRSVGNTFNIAMHDATAFTIGQGLYAQLTTKLPGAYYAEEVNFPVIDFKVTEQAFAIVQNPILVSASEDVEFIDFEVTDSGKPGQFTTGTILPVFNSNSDPDPYYIYADTGDAEHPAYLAVDKNQTTYWLTSEENSLISIDMGNGNARTADHYIMMSMDADLSWIFEGSNDEVSWDELDVNSHEFVGKQEVKFTIDVPESYRYYRWRFNNTEMVRIYELDLTREVVVLDD